MGTFNIILLLVVAGWGDEILPIFKCYSIRVPKVKRYSPDVPKLNGYYPLSQSLHPPFQRLLCGIGLTISELHIGLHILIQKIYKYILQKRACARLQGAEKEDSYARGRDLCGRRLERKVQLHDMLPRSPF